jgi:hypothetical protein
VEPEFVDLVPCPLCKGSGYQAAHPKKGEQPLDLPTEGLVLSAVLFQQKDIWIAACREHDVLAQGTSVDEASDQLGMMLVAYHLDKGDPTLKLIPKALPLYEALFLDAHPLQRPFTAYVNDPKKRTLTLHLFLANHAGPLQDIEEWTISPPSRPINSSG